MRATLRRPLAPIAVALLVVWAISVAGATGWGPTANWSLFVAAVALLGARALL
jgi:hypothetical protein